MGECGEHLLLLNTYLKTGIFSMIFKDKYINMIVAEPMDKITEEAVWNIYATHHSWLLVIQKHILANLG